MQQIQHLLLTIIWALVYYPIVKQYLNASEVAKLLKVDREQLPDGRKKGNSEVLFEWVNRINGEFPSQNSRSWLKAEHESRYVFYI